jgi:hypothetical protein
VGVEVLFFAVDFGVGVGVEVAVGVDVGVGVGVEVPVGVDVEVGVGVEVSNGVDVEVGVGVEVSDGVDVGVGVGVSAPCNHPRTLTPNWAESLRATAATGCMLNRLRKTANKLTAILIAMLHRTHNFITPP